jgi:hypothetical protein
VRAAETMTMGSETAAIANSPADICCYMMMVI